MAETESDRKKGKKLLQSRFRTHIQHRNSHGYVQNVLAYAAKYLLFNVTREPLWEELLLEGK